MKKINKKRIREQLKYLFQIAHRIGKESEGWPNDVKNIMAQSLKNSISILTTKGELNVEEVDTIKIEVIYGVSL